MHNVPPENTALLFSGYTENQKNDRKSYFDKRLLLFIKNFAKYYHYPPQKSFFLFKCGYEV